MGQAARDFVDFLYEAKQHYWQLLPISPTGYGDSPYQSSSAFAGNPYLLDPDQFVAEGLLTQADLEGCWGENPEETDYGLMYERRLPLLRRAFQNDCLTAEFDKFCQAEAAWLDDYALFMAVKAKFGGSSWLEWEADIRVR